jgi:hypothetical protein
MKKLVHICIAYVCFALSASQLDAQGLIDPTRPLNAPTKATPAGKVTPSTTRLTAVITRGEQRVAIFDGKVVNVGSRVGEWVVQEILIDAVRLSRAGRSEVFRLPKQSIVVRGGGESAPGSRMAKE